jgi:hypothetical protein
LTVFTVSLGDGTNGHSNERPLGGNYPRSPRGEDPRGHPSVETDDVLKGAAVHIDRAREVLVIGQVDDVRAARLDRGEELHPAIGHPTALHDAVVGVDQDLAVVARGARFGDAGAVLDEGAAGQFSGDRRFDHLLRDVSRDNDIAIRIRLGPVDRFDPPISSVRDRRHVLDNPCRSH